MKINETKTKIMMFNQARKIDILPEVKLNGNNIEVVDEAKLLGFMITNNLTWLGGGVSGGYRALFRFELPACYHPNLGIFKDVWLFQNFCVKNLTLRWSNHFLKI